MVAQARNGGPLVDGRFGADRAGDETAHGGLGDHRRVDAPSGAGCDGRPRRAGGCGPRPVHPRLRHVQDLPQQHEDADAEDARADARCGDDRARRPVGRGVRLRRRHMERRRAAAATECAHAARGAARLRRRHGAEDAGAGGRDRRRVPDAVDHDSCVRALHLRERRRADRHRLHRRRVDSRVRSRPGTRRRPRDRRDVSRQQGAEHPGRGRTLVAWRGSTRTRSAPSPRRSSAAAPRRRGAVWRTRSSPSASRSPARPSDCIEAIDEYTDARCTHVMLEALGRARLEQSGSSASGAPARTVLETVRPTLARGSSRSALRWRLRPMCSASTTRSGDERVRVGLGTGSIHAPRRCSRGDGSRARVRSSAARRPAPRFVCAHGYSSSSRGASARSARCRCRRARRAASMPGRRPVSPSPCSLRRRRLTREGGAEWRSIATASSRPRPTWSACASPATAGMAELMVELYHALRLHVQSQRVEGGRADTLGHWA